MRVVGAVQAPVSDLVAPPALAVIGSCTLGFSPSTGSPFTTGNGPAQPAVGDFNGDGNPDMAVPNFSAANVAILLGNGSGGFAPAPGSPIAVGAQPRSVLVGLFNGDS